MNILGIRALEDNYIWIIEHRHQAWVVDPGESEPVLRWLNEHQCNLAGILITHHHYDHTNGVEALLNRYPNIQVYAGHLTDKPYITQRLKQGDQITIADSVFQVLETPGHTLDHLSFYNDQALFCGDTLFTAGCGRVFEGTAQQMADSLLKLRALDDNLLVYCGHEYSLTNINFARIAEPDNQAIKQRHQQIKQKYQQHQACVPSFLGEEKQTNPFLRFDQKPLSSNISDHHKQSHSLSQYFDFFAALRAWKDELDRTGELDERI